MEALNRQLEEQLLEAGTRLHEPPPSAGELIALLDQVEQCLSRVEQSPGPSMQDALKPSVTALVSNELLRHSDTDVKVSVASCISEITRITAPEAPYEDDQMKEVFQLIVSSFERLSDRSSRSYTKRTLILETVAKVRSCVVMLDLECDALIIEMFQHFLKAANLHQVSSVISSMETIMTLVLEESEDISLELLSPILTGLKKDNQEITPAGRKLVEKVLVNCATKLKPLLAPAVKRLGFQLDDYSEVVTSITQGNSGAADLNDRNASGQVQGEAITVEKASPKETAKVAEGTTAEAASPGEGDPAAAEKLPKSIMSNGTVQTTQDSVLAPKSSDTSDHGPPANLLDGPSASAKTVPDNSETQKVARLEAKPELTSKRRAKKPNALVNSTEPSDSAHVDGEKEAEKLPHSEKSSSKEAHNSPNEDTSIKELAVVSEIETENHTQVSSPKALETQTVAIPTAAEPHPDESHSKKKGRGKKKGSAPRKAPQAKETVAKKASEEAGDSEGKLSDKKAVSRSARDDNTSEPVDEPKEDEIVRDSEAEAVNIPSTSPTEATVPNETRPKKVGRPKKNGSSSQEATPSPDVKKASEGTSDSEAKPSRRSDKKAAHQSTIDEEDETPTPVDAPKEDKVIIKAQAQSTKKSGKKVETSTKADGSSVKKGADKKKQGRGKTKLDKDTPKFPEKDDEEMVSSPKSAPKTTKKEPAKEETPKTSSKRKRASGKEKASDTKENKELIGLKIKVWWPDDQEFYGGVIDSYDPVTKKHKVLYKDGDEETLTLSEEKWEIVESESESDGEVVPDHPVPDDDSDEMPLKKAKTKPGESSKQGKKGAVPKSGSASTTSKSKTPTAKSGNKSKDDGKLEKGPKEETPKTGGKSEGSGSGSGKSKGQTNKSGNKSVEYENAHAPAPKTNTKSKQSSTPGTTKTKGKTVTTTTPASKSNTNGSSGKGGKTKEKDAETPKTAETPKGDKITTGKKRQRGTKS